jgi:hypothetical protein
MIDSTEYRSRIIGTDGRWLIALWEGIPEWTAQKACAGIFEDGRARDIASKLREIGIVAETVPFIVQRFAQAARSEPYQAPQWRTSVEFKADRVTVSGSGLDRLTFAEGCELGQQISATVGRYMEDRP